MKRSLLIAVIATVATAFLAAGCVSLEEILEVTPQDSCTISPQGGTFTVALSHNVEYQTAFTADWIHRVTTKTVERSSATFEVDKNLSGAERTCVITFTGEKSEKTVTVTQSAPTLQFSVEEVVLQAAGGESVFTVESNVPFDFAMQEQEWLSITGGSSAAGSVISYKLQAAANTAFAGREAEAVFSAADYGISKVLTIRQKGADLLSSDISELTFGPQEDTFEFDTDPTMKYTISDGVSGWITLSNVEGATNRKAITLIRNTSGTDRKAELIITGGNERRITLCQQGAKLVFSPETVLFDTEGGSQTLMVSGNVDYSAALEPGVQWCALAAEDPGVFTVSADSNAAENGRTCGIVFTNADYGLECIVEVVQAQKDAFEVSPQSIDLGPEEFTAEISIHSNVEYAVWIDCEWISAAGGADGAQRFSIAANTGASPREGHITFTGGSYSATVTIAQESAFITAPQRDIALDQSSAQTSVPLLTNIPVTAGCDAEWISSLAVSSDAVSFSVDDNDTGDARKAEILLYNDKFDIADTLFVTQRAVPRFELPQTAYSANPAGGPLQIEVDANIDYTYSIAGKPDWIKEIAHLVMEVAPNTSGQTRSCNIVFTTQDGEATVTITQQSAVLQADAPLLEFPREGGELSFTLTANVGFTADGLEADWFTCTLDDNGAYVVRATGNPSRENREHTISFVNEELGLQADVLVRQLWGEYFELLTQKVNLPPAASTIDVDVRTNMDCTCSVSAEWIRKSGNYTFDVAANTSGSERRAEIDFFAGETSYTLPIVQQAPYLMLSVTESTPPSEGGRISTKVFSNIDFTLVMPDADWIAFEQASEEGEYVFTVEETDSREPRTCDIVFNSEEFGMSCTMTVIQEGVTYFEVDPAQYKVGPAGGILSVIHNKCRDVKVDLESKPWIREERTMHTERRSVFSVDTNFTTSSRQVALVLTGNGISADVGIVQEAAKLEVDGTSRDVSFNGERFTIFYTCNFEPDFDFDCDWISVSLSSVSVSFDVEANTTGVARTATAILSGNAWGLSETITISQEANPVLEIDTTDIAAESDGGDFYVNVECNGTPRAATLVDWARCEATDQPGVFCVHVDANSSPRDRACSVFFTGAGLQKILTVNQKLYLNQNYYCSQDFSADRQVTQLQAATKGAGIPIILMGDAFSDRLIADGTYDDLMRKSADLLFSLEPYSSFRDLFNVYYVNVVSHNEIYANDSATALLTKFGEGTEVSGDDQTVLAIANSVLDGRYSGDAKTMAKNNKLVVVFMNAEVYAGTTYYYTKSDMEGDWGIGDAIVYMPLCTSEEQFSQVLVHEACGHGFGKLEDEYFYKALGTIPAEAVSRYRDFQQMGYYRNVDFTSDPAQVLWAKFLSDTRYQYDNLGVFEGACAYTLGAYRSTEDGIMRHNTGVFNAPSREAIYYRMHKLAYGDSWEYDFETFVSYDAVNRGSAPSSGVVNPVRQSRSRSPEPMPLHRPVMVVK